MCKRTKVDSERFNQSKLGRSLGVHGEKVQKLALSLLSNPYWNKTGSYQRSLAAMALETGLPVTEIPSLLRLLECLGFCTYQVRSARVVVPLLAQLYQRLLPKKSIISYRYLANKPLFNPEENSHVTL
jgi:hypothetical protein